MLAFKNTNWLEDIESRAQMLKLFRNLEQWDSFEFALHVKLGACELHLENLLREEGTQNRLRQISSLTVDHKGLPILERCPAVTHLVFRETPFYRAGCMAEVETQISRMAPNRGVTKLTCREYDITHSLLNSKSTYNNGRSPLSALLPTQPSTVCEVARTEAS